MTEYRTTEAQKSAITCIEGCIKAISEQAELPYEIGTLTVDYIIKFLGEYKKLIEKDLHRAEKRAATMPADILEALEMLDKEQEQLVKGQQVVTYHNGYALENPNRRQVRKPFTEQELEAEYDKIINKEAAHWGESYIYTTWAREAKAKNMQDWKEGKVVHVYSEEYHKDGMDWADTYYSDGTMITSNFGYTD